MEDLTLHREDYVEELLEIIRTTPGAEELKDKISDYHEKDIAEAITLLSEDERAVLYRALGVEWVSEIFTYLDDAEKYLNELSLERAAKVVSHMDSDDAIDVLDDLEEEQMQEIVKRLDKDAREDVKKLLSYEEDEIGSCMTNNFVCITDDLTIRGAMSALVKQAGENDNISTIYVTDSEGKFAGAIDLKDLIIAREHDDLRDIISSSFPYVLEHEKISECIETLTDYEEDSIPVLSAQGNIVGILTASDIVELVDDAMGDDYAKLAGLTEEEDLEEGTLMSMKKRLPWLIGLLFLSMVISTVTGMFEAVVAALPVVMIFQSMVLDMAGNVGTQSLAVTIRALMDENLTGKKKLFLVCKEAKVGLFNGICLGVMALAFLTLYIHFFKGYVWLSAFLIAACVGGALVVAMAISSMVGTLIPMLFHKIHIDPAVASGPLITTVNDLVAVVTYYGLAALLLIQVFHV